MVEDLDEGDILAQEGTPIEPGMSLDELIRATKRRSAEVLYRTLGEVMRGEASYIPLPDEEGSYFSWPTREQAKEFRRRGKRLL
jgi:methionyl-tRNA formyltransferase